MISKEQLLEIVAKRIDIPGVVSDLLTDVLDEALDELVKDTETPLDDVAKAALYPALVPVVLRLVEEKWAELVAPAGE
jgi:hypothetical protein